MRDSFIDFAKGVAIICVTLGHSIQMGPDDYMMSGQQFSNPLFMAIYSFHMPLLIILSGMLLRFSISKYGMFALIKKKCFGLIVPIITFGTLTWIIHWNDSCSFLHITKSLLITWLNTLWFLWAVLGNSIIIIIVEKSINNTWVKALSYLSIFGMLICLPDKFVLPYISFTYPFMLIGIWAIMLLAFNKEHLVYISGSSILNGRLISLNMIGIICYRYIIGLLGSVGFLGLLKRAHTFTTTNAVFEYLGKNTMAIYCFQIALWPLLFKHLGPIVPTTLVWQLLISSLMTGICLCLSKICHKIKILDTLFLGNR